VNATLLPLGFDPHSMGRWLRRWTKLHHYHYPVLGLCGLVATIAFWRPGEHSLGVGPLQVDAFYVALVGFGSLLVLGVTDSYDPADYGLDSDDE
jgi:hypothetical protein